MEEGFAAVALRKDWEEVGWNCGRISKSQFKEAWGGLDVLKHTLEL